MNQLNKGREDNVNETTLSNRMFAQPTIVFNPAEELLSRIREACAKQDPSVKKTLKEHKLGWRKNTQIITLQEQIYVPKDEFLRGSVIKAHHDLPALGHPGHYKTLELVLQ